MLLKLLLSVIDVLVGLILKLDDLLCISVLLSGGLSLTDHSVDIRVRETSR